MIWIAVGVTLALVAGLVFWWWRRRRRNRLISLVALLREPVTFDPAILASVAGRVWKADLGDGTAEGADGFVVGAGVMNTIIHQGRFFLINSFPKPYVENVANVAEGITDLRLRALFREHRAWFSCDALGVDGRTSEEEIRDWYHRLATLFAELLDENCLLIFLPDTARGYPINEDTEAALRSPDPVRALQETQTLPIVEVPDDDPLMKQAVAHARECWPNFVAAFEQRAGENFSVKAPVTRGANTEFIWLSVTSLEGDRIYGELGNEPGNLGSLKLGSKVSVLVSDLNDWCYLDPQGKVAGGFTVEAVTKAQRRRRAR
jgi:uncharacterized protein YegJ (DUF2314 family)